MSVTLNSSQENRDIRKRGAVGVIVRKQRLLVIERSQHVRAPGAICFPGGAIEDGESEPAALVRELREELDALVSPVHRLWTSVTMTRVQLHWWLAELPADAELRPNPEEVAAFDWLTIDQLRAHPATLASNLAFLDALAGNEFQIDGL